MISFSQGPALCAVDAKELQFGPRVVEFFLRRNCNSLQNHWCCFILLKNKSPFLSISIYLSIFLPRVFSTWIHKLINDCWWWLRKWGDYTEWLKMGIMNEPLPTYKLFSGVHLALLGKSEPESMFWWLKYSGLHSGSFSFGVLLSWDRPSLLRRKETRTSIQSLQCRVFHGFPVNIPLETTWPPRMSISLGIIVQEGEN